ncbi:aldose epimerase family protein [Alteromonas sp. A079]|uniref:aldose epimerase family protein n=1 Tax=Alteromonas sp. A079 TaxID=3410268 RepID=UPI003B9FBFCD
MKTSTAHFGSIDGQAVTAFTIENASGIQVTILNYGGIIHSLLIPDKNGMPHECVSSCTDLNAYVKDPSYRGAIVGRYANRIGNATFALNGATYPLDANGGAHNLHGGIAGFNKKIWHAEMQEANDCVALCLSLVSEDGEGGFPGNVKITATYELSNDNSLTFHVKGETDKATPLSITQHAYFTLSKAPTVDSTEVKIAASAITDVDETLLPTGDILPVANTPFDFSTQRLISSNQAFTHPVFERVGGYDHNYIVDGSNDDNPQAEVYASDTGIHLALYTSLPGIQFYTGELHCEKPLGALCLEPQYFPDSPNQDTFPSCIVYPDKPYSETIRYVFALK